MLPCNLRGQISRAAPDRDVQAMRIAFFEDHLAENFSPIALLRPVFELVCGHFSLRERIIRQLPVAEWGALLREFLVETYQEDHPEASVNNPAWLGQGPTLLLNGRWLPTPEGLAEIASDSVGLIDGTVVHLALDGDEAHLLAGSDWEDNLYRIARTRKRLPAPGRLAVHPWDLVEWNRTQIAQDFRWRAFSPAECAHPDQVALLGPPDAIFIDRSARVDPFVVLDARQGPVSIEAGAVIQSFTRLEGPCHVGRGSHLFRANVGGGTTIGPDCRVGGELHTSILHGFVNKAHDGFLGNSYLCPWVNLGALTTNSNLKNDYSTVRIPAAGQSIDSGLTKLGCFIGDHTKTGLGSLFNTGSSVGVMCMILPGGELLPKHIPSFTSIWHGCLADGLPLERTFAAAARAMDRRNCDFTAAQMRLLEYLHQHTKGEREAAFAQMAERNQRGAPLARP